MRSAFVMDGHVVPTVVVDAYRARPGLSDPRHNWKDEYIKTITDWARQHGVAGALRRHQRGDEREHKLGYHTIYGWLKNFQKKGDYFHTQKRGRKRILSQTECAEVQDAITKLRAEPNAESLTANTVASIARGVVSRTRPAVLAKNGGVFVMGAEWGRYHLHSVDWVCVMAVGWITPQPFAPLFSKKHVWCDSHGFPVAYYQILPKNKLTKKWAPFANFDLW